MTAYTLPGFMLLTEFDGNNSVDYDFKPVTLQIEGAPSDSTFLNADNNVPGPLGGNFVQASIDGRSLGTETAEIERVVWGGGRETLVLTLTFTEVAGQIDRSYAYRITLAGDPLHMAADLGNIFTLIESEGPVTSDYPWVHWAPYGQPNLEDLPALISPTITGTNASEVLFDTKGNESIFGGPGDDMIRSSGGRDTIDGGGGNDDIESHSRNGMLLGGAGDDTLNARYGSFTIQGGDGNDLLEGTIYDDTHLLGQAGDDTVFGGIGQDILFGGDGNDFLNGGKNEDTVAGGAGNDLVVGGLDSDLLDGGAGNDRMIGDGEFGYVSPSWSFDDTIRGGDGFDWIEGGRGNDRIQGGADGDRIFGGDGNDLAFGGDGNDQVEGGAGNDRLGGGAGADLMQGGAGNDRAFGDDGNDRLLGQFENDTLSGGAGNDVLDGDQGGDALFGGDGFDFLAGGVGSDRLNGGADADRFAHAGTAGHGTDWVQDYDATEGDLLVLTRGTGATLAVHFDGGSGAGDAAVDEAYVTGNQGRVLWVLVDGAAQGAINVDVGGTVFDLLG